MARETFKNGLKHSVSVIRSIRKQDRLDFGPAFERRSVLVFMVKDELPAVLPDSGGSVLTSVGTYHDSTTLSVTGDSIKVTEWTQVNIT